MLLNHLSWPGGVGLRPWSLLISRSYVRLSPMSISVWLVWFLKKERKNVVKVLAAQKVPQHRSLYINIYSNTFGDV